MPEADDSLDTETAGKVGRAADALRRGGAVAYPTETFYGLGAALDVPESVDRIFAIKRRPADKPLPLIAADAASAMTMWREVPEDAEKLMKRFWPGPLTIVLPASDLVPRCVAPFGEVGVRVSPHPVAQALAAAVGPLVATSANLSGRGEQTSAADLDPELVRQVDFVLDAGMTAGGRPSTLVRLAGGKATVLREGAIPSSMVEEALGRPLDA